MIYVVVLFLFVSIFILVYLGLSYISRDKELIENRVEQIKELQSIDSNSNMENNDYKSFWERAIMPYYKWISQFILKITSRGKIETLNKKLEKAGLLKSTTTEKWLFDKIMIILIVTAIVSLLVFMIESNIFKVLSIALLNVLLMNTSFNFYLSKKIVMRRKVILKDLPYILDLITVSVEAGLSFDGAIGRVVNSINGELCDEYIKSLKEIRMGIPRKTALKNMSERCEVKELSLLNTSIIQADELGVSLGNVLRIESSNLREHRKQITREKAMKVPIKMLFPLIIFIFPAIFIVILGPAVIKIYNVFMK